MNSMKRLALAALGFAFLGFGMPSLASADSLQDVVFNLNGTSPGDNSYAVPGLDSSAFNATTGKGTLVLTYDPGAAGSYFFDAWFDNELSTPFYNEYGAVSGTPASGQTWEIGDAQIYYNYPGPFPAPTGTDPGDDTYNNSLTDTNYLPGTMDNYLNDCGDGADCNGDASMAMGFAFTLGADQEEVITLNLSETNPGSGFYLEQIHPSDPNNPTETDLYFSGSAQTESTVPTVPEPSTLLLLEVGLAAGLIGKGFQKRFSPRKVAEQQ
jgi:hypothetical protein